MLFVYTVLIFKIEEYLTMIALQILDIKDFMSKLLIGAAFDPFWLSREFDS